MPGLGELCEHRKLLCEELLRIRSVATVPRGVSRFHLRADIVDHRIEQRRCTDCLLRSGRCKASTPNPRDAHRGINLVGNADGDRSDRNTEADHEQHRHRRARRPNQREPARADEQKADADEQPRSTRQWQEADRDLIGRVVVRTLALHRRDHGFDQTHDTRSLIIELLDVGHLARKIVSELLVVHAEVALKLRLRLTGQFGAGRLQ